MPCGGQDWLKLGSNDDKSTTCTHLEGRAWMGALPHLHLRCLLQEQGDAGRKGLPKINSFVLLALE